jgi:hypothetical protein
VSATRTTAHTVLTVVQHVPVANITAYEASPLDRSALTSLAKRAAQETPLKPAPQLGYLNHRTNEFVELLGPHWVLDHRMQNSEGTYGAHNEEDHTDDVYALLPNGELVYVRTSAPRPWLAQIASPQTPLSE